MQVGTTIGIVTYTHEHMSPTCQKTEDKRHISRDRSQKSAVLFSVNIQ